MTEDTIENGFKFGRKSLARLRTTDYAIQALATAALARTEIDFGIPMHGGKRTADEQLALYQRGSSKADGYEKQSAHQKGLALDVYAYVNGKALFEILLLVEIMQVFKDVYKEIPSLYNYYDIVFGADWKNFPDYGHVELRKKRKS